jgi:hypothetical protein
VGVSGACEARGVGPPSVERVSKECATSVQAVKRVLDAAWALVPNANARGRTLNLVQKRSPQFGSLIVIHSKVITDDSPGGCHENRTYQRTTYRKYLKLGHQKHTHNFFLIIQFYFILVRRRPRYFQTPPRGGQKPVAACHLTTGASPVTNRGFAACGMAHIDSGTGN